MSTHIGGPWRAVHRADRDRWSIVAGDGSIVIAQLKGYDEDDAENARLIAAAPELLDLAESFADGIEAILTTQGIAGTPHGVTLNNLLSTWHALLAQVEG